MADRPYTLLSCCMSLDGYLDSAGDERLVLSNPADLDRVDEVRAGVDAILVGAGTLRSDDPRLLVRSPARRADRVAHGLPPSPVRVTLTRGGCLDPRAAFFACGSGPRLVYSAGPAVAAVRRALGGLATVVDAGAPVEFEEVARELSARGVRRLMVEGGAAVLTQFLAEDLADELQLVVAPLFVGDRRARRFVDDAVFPWRDGRRATLVDVRPLGDVAVLRYALSDRFGHG